VPWGVVPSRLRAPNSRRVVLQILITDIDPKRDGGVYAVPGMGPLWGGGK